MFKAAIIAAAAVLSATPALAQHHGYDDGHARRGSNAAPSAFDWRSQLDRPGDYRCDAFWDANRDDCGAAWRDQRHRTSRGTWTGGHGNRHEHGYGYAGPRRGYGHASAGTTYEGAYGRPDIVFPQGGRTGYANHSNARDPHRIAWCRATYRSYDPHSGYYRGYSGQLIYCG